MHLSSTHTSRLLQYRWHVAIGLLCVAGVLLKFRAETQVAPRERLIEKEVTATYVGELESVRSNIGRQPTSIHQRAGYGVGVPNTNEPNELLKRLQPTLYIRFAERLAIDASDAERIRAAGPEIKLSLWQGEIVAVSGGAGGIISYEDYAGRVERTRSAWLVSAVLVAIISVLWFSAASLILRRVGTNAA